MNTSSRLVIIESGRKKERYFRDLWDFKELFFVLAARDLSVRYKQTIIGFLWTLIRPFITMVVFTFVFSKVAKLPSDGVIPYQLMVLAGILPWQFFSNSLAEASASVINNAHIVSKIYFPRLIIPVASVLVNFVDFLISFLMIFGMLIWLNVIPSSNIVFLPLFIFMATLAALGPGLILSTLNIKYRDFRYIVPFALQLGLYVSPIGFSSSIIPERWKILYYLNPVVSVIDGFRWAIFGGSSVIYWGGFLIGLTVTLLLFFLGVYLFIRAESKFIDDL